MLLLFTDWYAYTWYGKCFHIYTATFIYCFQVRRILGTANAFIYILLLLFTYWYAYTWYGKCFHIYTATFVYWLVRVYLVRQMLSYIYCYFCLLIGTRILGTANAFIYILLLLFTDWYAYTWYGKCFHIYTATFVYWLVRYTWYGKCFHIYTATFGLLIGTRILGTANAFIYILLLLFTYWYAYTWYGKCFHIYILLLLFTYWYAYTWYGKCFHIYTATFVYLLVGIYLVRQMLSYIYCYFYLLIGTHILGTANAFIYILLLLFTYWWAYTWYAYTWYGKCFHIYMLSATFVYLLVRVYLVRQMLSYIYCYFCLLIGT